METLGTHTITQVAIVVRDVAKTARAYADLFGLPMPEIIVTDSEEKAHTRYRGAPTPARARLAFFDMGSLALELIEPDGQPSTWQEFLDAHGEGIHHIAFEVKGMADAVTLFLRKYRPFLFLSANRGGF